ncbi:MAG TPA: ImmA/IrrE family metallo-endopeptidase [Alphaproteobacteria bacterium]|nr:ImmA/IrrE family metallo-endopeptidase [Alphaproteobacteria bacterium]
MSFNPARLALARKRQRLTSKGLAELIGVSPVTITRLEKGENEPDERTVKAIVEKTGFPYNFFFDKDFDELPKEAASFRSLTSITAKERDAALAAGAIAYMLSDWVEEKFNLPKPDLLDLSNERDPHAAALSLRHYWGLGEKPIGNMIKLLESRGIRVFSLAENTKNVDAFSCWRNETPFVFLNTFKSAERSRMDAAHELAHLVLHKHGGPQQKQAEQEANTFASAFLMPEADIKSKIPYVRSLEQLLSAKKRWGVSVSALVYRLHKMNILTEWQSRNFYIEINQRGFRTVEPDGIEYEESVVWQKVFSELWHERISKNHIADELNIPFEEVENLVFGLSRLAHKLPASGDQKTKLSLV